jgi:CRP/FNR family cyclic AMP-dependent transcriptional regulator
MRRRKLRPVEELLTQDPIDLAWAASFLSQLPESAQDELMATAREEELAAGQNIYRELHRPRFSILGLVVSGLLRSYSTSPKGRQVVVRYWHPGEVVGLTSVLSHGAPTGVEVVRSGSMLRMDPLTLERLGRRDVTVGWVIAEELARRLVSGAHLRIPSVFGSVRVRVSWHLMELASEVSGRMIARVTQQELADSVGSVREVVARVLINLSREEIITREGPLVVITDPERLRSIAESLDE